MLKNIHFIRMAHISTSIFVDCHQTRFISVCLTKCRFEKSPFDKYVITWSHFLFAEYSDQLGQMSHWDCEPSETFLPQEYPLPETIATFRRILGMKQTITVYPFFIHAFFMSIFASVIGPFGGFFASGFKRAFKIKVKSSWVGFNKYSDL